MRRYAFQVLAVLFLSAASLVAASTERWIHVRVERASGTSANVSINVPIEMAAAVLPSIQTDNQHHGKISLQASVNGADLRALLDATRNSPDNVFVTLERHDNEVSVAKSGRALLIKIVEKPGPEHHLVKTIAIKVPISVVQALLTTNSDELDIDSGMHALAREGEVDVTVNSEKETLRVWTDTHTTTE